MEIFPEIFAICIAETAKHLIKTWKEKNIPELHHFHEIQERVNKAIVPSNLGKLPTKSESVFDGFTADEWKYITFIFSIYGFWLFSFERLIQILICIWYFRP